jgi:hypothetical protein
MIWDPDNIPTEGGASAVAAYITAEIEAVCGESHDAKSPCMQELVKAVEHYVQEHADGEAVDAQYLVLLASQALSSIGNARAARRLYLFGSGMVRPSEWEVSGDRALWVLDLKQLTVHDGASLELIFFNGLRIILESISDVWDETSGRGVLGLRHICPAVSALLGNTASRRESAALAAEIRSLCARKLEQSRSERHWQHTPEVINLDL